LNLEKSEFLYKDGYGPGVPIFTHKGIKVIDNFIELFERELKEKKIKYSKLVHKHMISLDDFRKAYNKINNYENEVIRTGNTCVMSDALLQNVFYLKKIAFVENYVKTVFSVNSIYREKTGKLIPLYRDKNIFPVVQIDHLVHKSKLNKTIVLLKDLYLNFYKKLGIEIKFLKASEVPEYASFELYFLAQEKSKFTKLGMIYVLYSQFRQNLKLSDEYYLINSGFSGKSLFYSIESASNYMGELFIPTSSVHIINKIAKSDKLNKVIKIFNEEKISFYIDEYEKNTYKKWKKSGDFALLVLHEKYTLHIKTMNMPVTFNNINTMIKCLIDNFYKVSTELLNYSRSNIQQNLETSTLQLCENCITYSYYGLIETENTMTCLNCGKVINYLIFNIDPKDRFY
jgi:hypothetical protein